MSAFRYRALDAGSREQRGVLEAESPRQARGRLRERGLYPVAVEAVGDEGRAPGARWRSGVSAQDLMICTGQWATLLEAGLTVEQSLATLAEQEGAERLRQVLAGVRAEVVAGHTLQAALERFPAVFPRLYRALAGAGERSGQLPAVFARLAHYLEAEQALRRRVGQALVYPAVLGAVALAIVAGLLAFVVPQVAAVFVQSHQRLPLPTRLLLGLSASTRVAAPVLLVAAGLGGWALRRLLRRSAPRRAVDGLLLRAPLLGSLLRRMDSARFAATLAILHASGVPLLVALETAREVMGNTRLREGIDLAVAQVREGVSLHRALGASGSLPSMLVRLVASGEASGRLERALEQGARQQQAELEGRITVLLTLFEPALLLVMGAVVLFIVLAILLPVIEMNQLVR